MRVVHLPADILPEGASTDDAIIFHDYTAVEGSMKGKSILHRNAISLVVNGEKTMVFAEKTLHIHHNTFHFLSAGNCLASVKLSRQGLFRSILVFFTDNVLADFYLKYDQQIRRIRGKKKIASESYVSFDKDDFVRQYIASLEWLLRAQPKLSPERKLLKLEELLLHLLETQPELLLSFAFGPKGNFDELDIRRTVETNIARNITLDELAFLCNMSVSTFKRRFTKIYGASPNKWMLSRRMELARDLLQHYHEKPSEVYHKVGYENHSSFSASFKKVFGLTPKDFQSRQLNAER
jgi:AraC-like DNA-binding protein